MKSFSIISAIIFLIIATLIVTPATAQYFGWSPFWGFQPAPPFPVYGPWGIASVFINPYPLYARGYRGLLFPPVFPASPVMVEPTFRAANTPTPITIPTVTTAAPLTGILNLIDPALLASGIAVLTNNYPTIFNALVTTFNLPLL